MNDARMFVGVKFQHPSAIRDLIALGDDFEEQFGRVKALRDVTSRQKILAIKRYLEKVL